MTLACDKFTTDEKFNWSSTLCSTCGQQKRFHGLEPYDCVMVINPNEKQTRLHGKIGYVWWSSEPDSLYNRRPEGDSERVYVCFDHEYTREPTNGILTSEIVKIGSFEDFVRYVLAYRLTNSYPSLEQALSPIDTGRLICSIELIPLADAMWPMANRFPAMYPIPKILRDYVVKHYLLSTECYGEMFKGWKQELSVFK